MYDLTVRGQDGGCNGCDGLYDLTVWGQDGGCNGCDGLYDLIVWGQDGVMRVSSRFLKLIQ